MGACQVITMHIPVLIYLYPFGKNTNIFHLPIY